MCDAFIGIVLKDYILIFVKCPRACNINRNTIFTQDLRIIVVDMIIKFKLAMFFMFIHALHKGNIR